eukprot:gene1867-4964_t
MSDEDREWHKPRRRLTAQTRQRKNEVLSLVKGDTINVNELQNLAFQYGGFMNSDIRKVAWPYLVGVSPLSKSQHYDSVVNPYQRQIELDINRSLWQIEQHDKRNRWRSRLSRIINALMAKYPDLHYYQGFHDIVTVPLLELDNDDTTFNVMCRLCRCHLKEYMEPSMNNITSIMYLALILIQTQDSELFDVLKRVGMGSEFTVSWILTWFSHVLADHATRCRVFDACLASHPYFVVYVAASVVLSQRSQLLAAECEFSVIYKQLTQVSHVNWEAILKHARELSLQHSPQTLRAVCAKSSHRQILLQSDIDSRFAALVKDAQIRLQTPVDTFHDFESSGVKLGDWIQLAIILGTVTLSISIWAVFVFLPRHISFKNTIRTHIAITPGSQFLIGTVFDFSRS